MFGMQMNEIPVKLSPPSSSFNTVMSALTFGHVVIPELTLWGELEHAEWCTGSIDEAAECLVPLYETVFHMSLNRR
jgi:hypothetical protein